MTLTYNFPSNIPVNDELLIAINGQDVTDEYYNNTNTFSLGEEPTYSDWTPIYSKINTQYSYLLEIDPVITGYYRYNKDKDNNKVTIEMKSTTSTPWCFNIDFYSLDSLGIKMLYYTDENLSIVGEGNRVDLFCVSTFEKEANPDSLQTSFQSVDIALNTSYKPIDTETVAIKCSEEKPLYIGSIFGSDNEDDTTIMTHISIISKGIMTLPYEEITAQMLVLQSWKNLKTKDFLYSQNYQDLSNIQSLFNNKEYTQIETGAKYKRSYGLLQVASPINTATGIVIKRYKPTYVLYDELFFIVYNS